MNPQRCTVLVADDSATVRGLVARILGKAGFTVIEAADGLEALSLLLLERPDVAVLDHEMPGCSGLEVLTRVKAQAPTSDIAVLLLTSVEETGFAAEVFAAGATDFVRKPCEPAELAARVRQAAAQRVALADLDRRSSTDPLTGLPNRRGMAPVLEALEGPRAAGIGMLVIDIDHFKRVNDTWGHDAGDLILRTVAGRLRATSGPCTVARWGGEEFVAAGPCDGSADLRLIGDQLRRAVAAVPCEIEVDDELVAVEVTVSIGAVFVADGEQLQESFARADAALYEAKESGRNMVVVAGDDGVEVRAEA